MCVYVWCVYSVYVCCGAYVCVYGVCMVCICGMVCVHVGECMCVLWLWVWVCAHVCVWHTFMAQLQLQPEVRIYSAEGSSSILSHRWQKLALHLTLSTEHSFNRGSLSASFCKVFREASISGLNYSSITQESKWVLLEGECGTHEHWWAQFFSALHATGCSYNRP